MISNSCFIRSYSFIANSYPCLKHVFDVIVISSNLSHQIKCFFYHLTRLIMFFVALTNVVMEHILFKQVSSYQKSIILCDYLWDGDWFGIDSDGIVMVDTYWVVVYVILFFVITFNCFISRFVNIQLCT